MATYKLIQDIEAEDHILGPLSLRQFIFALITAFCLYICFILITKHVYFLLIFFVPPALFFGFFAVPFGRDQPTEVWALAKLRYLFKPRKRIWDQSGVKELVSITVPKKIERHLTNGLNQYEVASRLNALASTLDSRGWAVKNSNGLTSSSFAVAPDDPYSDRLVDLGEAPIVPEDQISAEADMLDEDNSPIAQHFSQMINQNSLNHRQELIQQMNSPTPVSVPQPAPASPSQQWFMPNVQQSAPTTITATDVSAQNATPDETALAEQIKAQRNAQQAYFGNLRTLQPAGSQPTVQAPNQPQPQTAPTSPVQVDNQASQTTTVHHDPAIISLASNNDFTVDTIAREAKRAKDSGLGDNDEVVIPLH
jgi:hypothetical protein